LQTNPSDIEIHRIEPILGKEYVRLAEDKESFLKQKSRLQWLNLGDKNSKFSSIWWKVFTTAIEFSLSIMIMECILQIQGRLRILLWVIFRRFWGGFSSDIVLDSSMLSGALPRRLSLSQSTSHDTPITNEEIQKTLFSIKDNKPPCSDGFSVGFFKKSWVLLAWTLLMLSDLSSLLVSFSSR